MSSDSANFVPAPDAALLHIDHIERELRALRKIVQGRRQGFRCVDIDVAYDELLAQQPRSRTAGSPAIFVEAISRLLEREDIANLGHSRRNYLYKLRGKWHDRAIGKVPSWDRYGSKPGRRKRPAALGPQSRAGFDPTVDGDDDERDPLLTSIMRKFGKPREERSDAGGWRAS